MILVADSGSTKTDWAVLNQESKTFFKTQGVNPLFLDANNIQQEISQNCPTQIDKLLIKEVHFYGPACSTQERCLIVKQLLIKLFPNSNIKVESDLLATARALFQKESGIACILGTGSNSGYYNGEILIEKTFSTGYILGDQASGANLGLELIKKYINHELPKNIEILFHKKYQLTIPEIIDRVYKGEYPNRFLASFAPFLHENINEPEIKAIVDYSFSRFLDLHILPYPEAKTQDIAFVGSVAYYFSELIKDLANKKGLSISKIIKEPIQDLLKFHSE